MCGIVGAAGFHEPGLVQRMCDRLEHRGPDSGGLSEQPDIGISIGARRLAIIDVEGGTQPMVSGDGLVRLVFNGEIYNHRALCNELSGLGYAFKTRCDTEVVLAAYETWGERAWKRLNGMFSVAIADRRKGKSRLVIARDRFGIKPLYYTYREGRLVFSSEIKALLQWQGLSVDVDPAKINAYLRYRFVPGPGCLLKGVRKLPAGHVLTFENGEISLFQWWFPPGSDQADPALTWPEVVERFHGALRESVERHLVSDVPLGAFLSGGIDSSAIVALMARASSQPVHTFSVAFRDFSRDEVGRAEKTAKMLKTDHITIDCTSRDMADLPEIAWALDEPIGDAIVVPMHVLAREARRKVKVVLSGDGADEILGGYLFHEKLMTLERWRSRLPGFAWPLAAGLMSAMPARQVDAFFDYPGDLGKDGKGKLARLLHQVPDKSLVDLYQDMISLFDDDGLQGLLRNAGSGSSSPTPNHGEGGSVLHRLLMAQYGDWLPDDILMKLDKITMANSLEARVPFMDDKVVDAAATIPERFKTGRYGNKRLLREGFEGLLPPEVLNSRKEAFFIPLDAYMETAEMKDIVGWALDPVRVKRRGLFVEDSLKGLLSAGPDRGFLPSRQAFSVVMLELWFERFCPEASWA